MTSDVAFYAQLRELFQLRVLPAKAVIALAIEQKLDEHRGDPAWIKAHFSDLVQSIQERAYRIYLESEKAAAGSGLRDVLLASVGPNPTVSDVLDELSKNIHALDRFFLGLTQGRRVRAGGAFEELVRHLFEELKYPFSRKPRIDGNPDFVMPSKSLYDKNPLNCIVFTVKRTLRERWRQIVTEGAKARGFYLATIDEDVTARDIKEMERQKIFLVVPLRVKTDTSHYAAAGNVLTFEEFLAHHLDPARLIWQKSGDIA